MDSEKFDGAGALVCESLNFAGDRVLTYVARVPFRNTSHFARVRWWEENGIDNEPDYLFCAHNFQVPPTNWMSWEVQPGYMQFFSTPYEALADTIPWFPISSWGEDELTVVDEDLFYGARELRGKEAEREKAIAEADKERDRLAKEAEDNRLKSIAKGWVALTEKRPISRKREDVEISIVDNLTEASSTFVVRAFKISGTRFVVHEKPSNAEVLSGKFDSRRRADRQWVLTHVPSGWSISPANDPAFLSKHHAHAVAAAMAELDAAWSLKRPDLSMNTSDKAAAKFILKTVSELYARGITDWTSL